MAPDTPAQHRTVVAKIALPKYDSQLFRYDGATEATARHGHLAKELRPLRLWLRLSEIEPDHFGTAANDNARPALDSDDLLDAEIATDNRAGQFNASGFEEYPDDDGPRDYTAPTLWLHYLGDKFDAQALIDHYVGLVANDNTRHPRAGKAEFELQSQRGWHDQEFGKVRVYGREVDDEDVDDAQEAEAANDDVCLALDKLDEVAARKREIQRDKASRRHMRELLPGRLPAPVSAHKRTTKPPYHEPPLAGWPATLIEFCVDGSVPFYIARARNGLPEVANDNMPAYPHFPRDPRRLFLSCQSRAGDTASHGSPADDGMPSRIVDKRLRDWLRDKLDPTHVNVLDAALIAKNFREVGALFGGGCEKTQERNGQRLVREACAALDKEVREFTEINETIRQALRRAANDC